jgi:hypothetical protein
VGLFRRQAKFLIMISGYGILIVIFAIALAIAILEHFI